jgi:intracellular septation protein
VAGLFAYCHAPMKLLFDFFPLILMFAAYKAFGIYIATAVAIVATLIQVGYLKAAGKKVEPMMWVSLVIIIIFGGLTIALKNELFIKWKPTILFLCMAVAIAVSQFGFNKNPIAIIFNNQITAPDALWKKLAWAWISFLVFVAVLNLYFVYYTSTDTWFLFKTFGDMGLFFVFIVAQMFWLYPYMPQDDADAKSTPAAEPIPSEMAKK